MANPKSDRCPYLYETLRIRDQVKGIATYVKPRTRRWKKEPRTVYRTEMRDA
jgi:hypothetical protein